jgi:hypothetical protein
MRASVFANVLALELREAEEGRGGERDAEPSYRRQSLATPRREEGKGE